MLFQICLLWALLSPQEPTLPETLEFLTAKLPEIATYTGTSAEGFKNKTRVTESEFTSCTARFTVRQELSKAITTAYADTWKFPLGLIDPARMDIKISEDADAPKIVTLTIRTKDDKPVMEQSQIFTASNTPPRRARGFVKSAMLTFESRESAERIQKAFAHAAKLCSERKEPF